jgi:hypothetical protein
MQDHDGKHTCNEGGVQNPCPKDQIFGMIDDGVNGTPAGDGLKQTLAQAGNDEVAKWYRAARIYNSGSVSGENLGMGVATHCYASDIANRLVGWSSGASSCQEGAIGNMGMSEGFDRNKQPSNNQPSSSAPSSPSAMPTPTETPVVKQPTVPEQPSSTSSPSSTASPSSTSAPSSTASPSSTSSPSAPVPTAPSNTYPTTPAQSITPPAPSTTPITKPGDANTPGDHLDENAPVPAVKGEHYPGAQAGCHNWYLVKKGDYCQKVEQGLNIPEGTLVKLNAGLNPDCRNLWLDYAYCVQI